MIYFNCDYLEGAMPCVMQKLSETNLEQTPGYGEDAHCARAREMIRELCRKPDADVHFIVGGTQTNFIFLASALKPWQGVISADTGHIATHETGAVEATGHKVIALPGHSGKLDAGQVSEYCRLHFSDEAHEHLVMPGAVYISNPTEFGTLYTREELLALHSVCERWNLILYLDGARLGYGLASPENQLDLPYIADMCDAFYIGGTKQGLLFGEALVICNKALQQDFRYIIKQRGAMFAKGRLLGLQFEAAFENGDYFRYSEQAIRLAIKLKDALTKAGFPFKMDSPTNQLFPILPDALLNRLKKDFTFNTIERVDASHTCVRFCTSWATTSEQVEALIRAIEESV